MPKTRPTSDAPPSAAPAAPRLAALAAPRPAAPGADGPELNASEGSLDGNQPKGAARFSDEAVLIGTLTSPEGPPRVPPSIPDLEVHDLAKLFPEMTEDEYAEFRDDIAAGIRPTPTVWMYEGKIIDGRHGYRACLETGTVPDIREWHGDGSPLAFVIAVNLHRRQLTSSQRACVATEIESQLAVEATARRTRGKADPTQKPGEGAAQDRHAGEAAEQAAKLAGTNRDYVLRAKKVRRLWPEQFERVRSGEIELPEADRLLRESMRALKEHSIELHEQVVRGGKTVPQAQRLAKRLPPKALPAPNDVGVPAGISGCGVPGDGDPSGDGKAATDEFAASQPNTPVDRPLVLARGDEGESILDRLIALWRTADHQTRMNFLDTPAVRAAIQRRDAGLDGEGE